MQIDVHSKTDKSENDDDDDDTADRGPRTV